MTQTHLSAWYRQPQVPLTAEETNTAAAVLWLLRGDAGQRALIAWHMGWEPARQTAGMEWLAPFLAETLTDTYSVVRYIGQRSLKRSPEFQSLTYDYIGPAAQHAQARQQVLELWRAGRRTAKPAVLLEAGGALRTDEFQRLLNQRNDHPMELWE